MTYDRRFKDRRKAIRAERKLKSREAAVAAMKLYMASIPRVAPSNVIYFASLRPPRP